MFCPTSALSGGGVRGVLPPPPRSRGSLLPPTPQLLSLDSLVPRGRIQHFGSAFLHILLILLQINH